MRIARDRARRHCVCGLMLLGMLSGHAGRADEMPSGAIAVAGSDAGEVVPLGDQATEFLRGVVLLLLPPTFEDTRQWGKEKRIQSGLSVDIDGGNIRTNRRWKNVNHGSWSQVHGTLRDPGETLKLQLSRLPAGETGASRWQIVLSATIRAVARQQQWSYGVMLWSITADAEFDVSLQATVSVSQKVITTEQGGVRLQLLPMAETASARVTRFSLRRISHAKGAAIREFGSWFEWLVDDLVREENRTLADKINRRLEDKQDRLTVPLWFSFQPSDAGPRPVER